MNDKFVEHKPSDITSDQVQLVETDAADLSNVRDHLHNDNVEVSVTKDVAVPAAPVEVQTTVTEFVQPEPTTVTVDVPKGADVNIQEN